VHSQWDAHTRTNVRREYDRSHSAYMLLYHLHCVCRLAIWCGSSNPIAWNVCNLYARAVGARNNHGRCVDTSVYGGAMTRSRRYSRVSLAQMWRWMTATKVSRLYVVGTR
jgi:hypothetical protein